MSDKSHLRQYSIYDIAHIATPFQLLHNFFAKTTHSFKIQTNNNSPKMCIRYYKTLECNYGLYYHYVQYCVGRDVNTGTCGNVKLVGDTTSPTAVGVCRQCRIMEVVKNKGLE